MWHGRLKKVYSDFAEWRMYAEMYNLHTKLGYKTPETAWKRNPMVQGDVDPSVYGRYKPKKAVKK